MYLLESNNAVLSLFFGKPISARAVRRPKWFRSSSVGYSHPRFAPNGVVRNWSKTRQRKALKQCFLNIQRCCTLYQWKSTLQHSHMSSLLLCKTWQTRRRRDALLRRAQRRREQGQPESVFRRKASRKFHARTGAPLPALARRECSLRWEASDASIRWHRRHIRDVRFPTQAATIPIPGQAHAPRFAFREAQSGERVQESAHSTPRALLLLNISAVIFGIWVCVSVSVVKKWK